MPFPVIRIDDPGGFVASCVIIGAGLIKGAVEMPEIVAKMRRRMAKAKGIVEPEVKAIQPDEEVEVLSKKDFDLVLEEIKSANFILTQTRNSFEDTLACMAVINIMFDLMGEYALDTTIKIAETKIYAFLRHNEFPSKIMIGAMFEQVIEDTYRTRKERKHGVDSRPGN